MPLLECSICKDEKTRSAVDELLDAGKSTYTEIAAQTGASRASIFRHSRHREERGGGEAGKSPQAKLYARIEKQLSAAERRRDWKLAGELISRLTTLQKTLPREEPEARAAARPGHCKCGRVLPSTTIKIVESCEGTDALSWQSCVRRGFAKFPQNNADAEAELLELLRSYFGDKETHDEIASNVSETPRRAEKPTEEKG